MSEELCDCGKMEYLAEIAHNSPKELEEHIEKYRVGFCVGWARNGIPSLGTFIWEDGHMKVLPRCAELDYCPQCGKMMEKGEPAWDKEGLDQYVAEPIGELKACTDIIAEKYKNTLQLLADE